ncbi:unnamed protein product [Urochloa humidicola]
MAPKEAPPAPELPDAVVEDILLRLDAGADVVRASAVSRAYRRVSCDFAFLRRVRVRPPHPPPLLGAFDSGTGAGGSHFHPPRLCIHPRRPRSPSRGRPIWPSPSSRPILPPAPGASATSWTAASSFPVRAPPSATTPTTSSSATHSTAGTSRSPLSPTVLSTPAGAATALSN